MALPVLPVPTANLPEGLTVSDAATKENPVIGLIKSIVVIPLVMAVVMGTGWGLVRWSARLQAESGIPDPRPAERAADGSLSLQMPFAQVSGEISYHGGRHQSLGNWRRADETVTWKFEVEKPGRYAVELDCACNSADAGSVIRVEMAGAALQATIPDTGGSNTFKTVRAGEVEVPSAGWFELRIAPVTIAHQSVMILRGVKLVPNKS
jgi:hypothetical protein